MSAERFELSTNGLKGRCSAIELRARKRADCILSCESRGVNVIYSHQPTSMQMEEQMAEVEYVNEANFQTEVVNFSEPVLVDVTAVWCGPCRMIDPIVKQLAQEWQGKVKVVKLDADENPGVLMQYGILGIPTLMFFKGGKLQERMTGFLPKEKLVAKLSPHLK